MNESRKGWVENFDEEWEAEMNLIWRAWPVAWVCVGLIVAHAKGQKERKSVFGTKNINDLFVKLTSQLFPRLTCICNNLG